MSRTVPASASVSVPPPLPADTVYTYCYCEENIFLLARQFEARAKAGPDWPWDVYVIVISNGGKTVALWSPKVADRDVVVWDYHVALALRPRDPRAARAGETQTWVYDLDTRLAVPCCSREYVAGTFPYALTPGRLGDVEQCYHSLFRVIPARDFLDHFASDRSHMSVDEDSGTPYACPPPPYPPLCGVKARELGITNNLMDAFVSMSAPTRAGAGGPDVPHDVFGEVMDMARFLSWMDLTF